MSVKIVNEDKNGITLNITIKFNKSMLQGEKDILKELNTAGCIATAKLLNQFDSDGSPIKIGNLKLTTKGKSPKEYQTPFGLIEVDRHVYQSSKGGKTFCPLDQDARIVLTSTPKFAQMISSKYTQCGVRSVVNDLVSNHDRHVQKAIVQDVGDAVGSLAVAKENVWEYDIPELHEDVRGISIGLDATCMLIKDEGWREAMTGTITLYSKSGERLHTIYTAAPPEYGKSTFLEKFEAEILGIKKMFPKIVTIGLADGARDNWPFLNTHTDYQLVDFYHVSGYIGSVGQILKKRGLVNEMWVESKCHDLKHKMGAASRILKEIQEIKKNNKKKFKKDDALMIDKAISYFRNNNQKKRMQYYKYTDTVLPIGSGATEAACKVIVKQRMCKSGMRWKSEGARVVLEMRSLHETKERWEQFWEKVDRFGFNIAA